MTSLQQTAMLGGSASAKVASYTLVAADAGTTVSMSNAGSTTITVNTGLFAAGDTVTILNIGAGTCTITAGTATVSKATNATLALVTNAGGVLYFTATGAATFLPFDVGSAGASKSYSLLGSAALTGAATVTISGVTGDDLFVIVAGASSVSASSQIAVRFNGITSNKYNYNGPYTQGNSAYSTGVFARETNAPDSQNGAYLGSISSNAASSLSGYLRIFGCKSTTVKPFMLAGGASDSTGNGQVAFVMGGVFTDAAAITSVSIFSGTGNLDSGTVYVYEAQ
jgi:hypothetical protein